MNRRNEDALINVMTRMIQENSVLISKHEQLLEHHEKEIKGIIKCNDDRFEILNSKIDGQTKKITGIESKVIYLESIPRLDEKVINQINTISNNTSKVADVILIFENLINNTKKWLSKILKIGVAIAVPFFIVYRILFWVFEKINFSHFLDKLLEFFK